METRIGEKGTGNIEGEKQEKIERTKKPKLLSIPTMHEGHQNVIQISSHLYQKGNVSYN